MVAATSGEDPVDFLWLRATPAPRTLAPPLSTDQIAAAAIALADQEGVDGLSMRRVASSLGCGTMSLYRHFRTKEELLDFMIDTVAGEQRPPAAASGDWQADLRDAARRLRATALRHPWLPRLVAARRSFGPNSLAAVEFALSAVDGLGLSIDEMGAVVQNVHAFVHGFALDELADHEWRNPRTGSSQDPWRLGVAAYIGHLTETGTFPLFARLAVHGNDSPDPDDRFEWHIQRILDGLALIIPASRPPAEQDNGFRHR